MCSRKVRRFSGDSGRISQGSALSSFVFTIVMDCMTGYPQREPSWGMVLADDVVLCGKSRDEVEIRLE